MPPNPNPNPDAGGRPCGDPGQIIICSRLHLTDPRVRADNQHPRPRPASPRPCLALALTLALTLALPSPRYGPVELADLGAHHHQCVSSPAPRQLTHPLTLTLRAPMAAALLIPHPLTLTLTLTLTRRALRAARASSPRASTPGT